MTASDEKTRDEEEQGDEPLVFGMPPKRFIVVVGLAYLALLIISGMGALVPGDEFQINLSAFFNCAIFSSLFCVPFIVYAWRLS